MKSLLNFGIGLVMTSALFLTACQKSSDSAPATAPAAPLASGPGTQALAVYCNYPTSSVCGKIVGAVAATGSGTTTCVSPGTIVSSCPTANCIGKCTQTVNQTDAAFAMTSFYYLQSGIANAPSNCSGANSTWSLTCN